MTSRICNALIALGCLLAAESAWAHHNRSDVDMTKRSVLTGTLTKVDWKNPHIEFVLEVKGDNGQALSWSIDSGPPNSFKSRKISRVVFEKALGQTVAMEVSTARDGSRLGTLWKITFQDGAVVDTRL